MKSIEALHHFMNAPRQIRWASFRTSFCDVLSESVGARTIRQKLLEDDEDMIFLLSFVKGIRKKVPECLEIDAQLDILRVFFFFLRYGLKFCIPLIHSRNPTTLQASVIALAVIHVILSLPKSGDSNSRLK
jgi:hypothetical protein